MNSKKYIILFFAVIIGINWVFAQSQDTLKREVEVIKEYQPTISGAKMISETPKIKDSVQVAPTFNYQIKSTPIDVEKSINTIGRVDFIEGNLNKNGLGYLKAGFGNGFANYGKLLINSKPSENSGFGIYFNHYYEYAKAKLISDLDVKTLESNQEVLIFGNNDFRKNQLKWELGYDHSAYDYYGFHILQREYLQTLSALLINNNEITSQSLNKFRTKVDFSNTNSRSKTDYRFDIQNNYFWNKTGQKSDYLVLTGDATVDNDDYKLNLKGHVAYNYQDSVNNVYTGIWWSRHSFVDLALTPTISFEGNNWAIRAGFNFGSVFDADTATKFHFSPDIYLQFEPIENVLKLFAGADGGIQTNQYSKSVYENPYQRVYSDLLPTEKVIEIYGGFKGAVNKGISYVLDVNYSVFNNYIQYYSTFAPYDYYVTFPDRLNYFENYFLADYIDLSVLKFGCKIRYTSDLITVQLNGGFMKYKSDQTTLFSHLPKFDLGFDLNTKITSQLSVYANSNIIGKKYGVVKYNSVLPYSAYYQIPTKIDVNIGAKYDYTSNLSFYFDVQNLLNQNYQNWYGYVDPGMICTIGARLSF